MASCLCIDGGCADDRSHPTQLHLFEGGGVVGGGFASALDPAFQAQILERGREVKSGFLSLSGGRQPSWCVRREEAQLR